MARNYKNFKICYMCHNFLVILALSYYLATLLVLAREASSSETASVDTPCNAELESKFLPKDGKCRYSGLHPVRGSCTAYIPCISFGGDLMKPLKRVECSRKEGLAFDLENLRCAPAEDLRKCLQRDCYPNEANFVEGTITSAGIANAMGEKGVSIFNMAAPLKPDNRTVGLIRNNSTLNNSTVLTSSTSSVKSTLKNYFFSVLLTATLLINSDY